MDTPHTHALSMRAVCVAVVLTRRVQRRFRKHWKLVKKLTHAINEIVQSERSYHDSLANGLQMEKQLKWRAELKDPVISMPEVQSLFCNWAELRTLSEIFVERLETRVRAALKEDSVPSSPSTTMLKPRHASRIQISDIFLELLPFCKIYTEYVNNFDVSTAQELTERSEMHVSLAFMHTKIPFFRNASHGLQPANLLWLL